MNFATWFAGHLLLPVTGGARPHFDGAAAPEGIREAAREPATEGLAMDGAGRVAGGELWVVLTGKTVDREVVAVACAMAHAKHAAKVHAVYCIEAPRALPVDEPLPVERRDAADALERAAALASQEHIGLECVCLQARCASEGVVRVLAGRRCATLFVGSPYRTDGGDEVQLSELAAELLRSAPCRVHVVRGMAQPTQTAAS